MTTTPTPVQLIADIIKVQTDCTEAEAQRYAAAIANTSRPLTYSPWRHGGWYVNEVRYASGACGCVSRNYDDGQWRIACGRPHEETFKSREAAARAERLIALAEYTPAFLAAEIAKRQPAAA